MKAVIIFLVIIVAILFIISYMVMSDTKYLIWFRSKTITWNSLKRRTATIIGQKTPLLEYPMLIYLNFNPDIRRIYTEEGYSAYVAAITKKLNDVVDNIFSKPISQTNFRSKEEQEIDEISKLDKESGYEEEEVKIVQDSGSTPIMSVFDIVNETVEYYSWDITRRAIYGDVCMYRTPEGKMCSVGRCLKPGFKVDMTKSQTLGQFLTNHNLDSTSEDLDTMLKREYRGHSISFWRALQTLHDVNYYWDESGITESGKLKAEEIIKQFS
jgi:hypothetical protein